MQLSPELPPHLFGVPVEFACIYATSYRVLVLLPQELPRFEGEFGEWGSVRLRPLLQRLEGNKDAMRRQSYTLLLAGHLVHAGAILYSTGASLYD